MKSESPAKKHHFWILLGLVPLLTLIGVIIVSGKVGGEIADRQSKIDGAKKDIASKANPKSDALLKELDKVATTVEKKQGLLHKENWERQKNLFTWPGSSRPGTSRVFSELEQKNLKFGDPIPDLTAVHSEFQRAETYRYEYSSLKKDGTGVGTGMADLMAPTQFGGGGWRSVLRYVDDFENKNITKEQVWLVLEDMWVQSSLLKGIRSVNTDMAAFSRVKYEKNKEVIDDPAPKAAVQNKTKRLFRSRIWEVALEFVPEGTNMRLTGTLTNISDRLQLLGKFAENGNGMTLHVWLSPDAGAAPIVFKIGGEYLPGVGAKKTIKDKDSVTQVVDANVMNIVPTKDHLFAPGDFDASKLELARVEQVFDVRTVPIKRIDALELGNERALDSRNAGKTLFLPDFKVYREEAAAAATDASSTTGGTDGKLGGSSLGPGGSDGFRPPGGPPGSGSSVVIPGIGGMGGTGRQSQGGGTLATVVDANKKRYIEDVTKQVRRMPVALVVIVDQSYMQDVLLALSNSPLRFQITQVAWTRFHGPLEGTGTGSSTGGFSAPGGIDFVPGKFGSGFGGSGDPDAPRPNGGGSRPPMGTGGTGLPPMGPPNYPGSSGLPGSGYPSSSGPSAMSDSQITSGLVELSVYGIVSLYEKYEDAKPADAKPADATTTPMPNTPMPNTPMPNTPMPGVPNPPTPPKMRRRVRA